MTHTKKEDTKLNLFYSGTRLALFDRIAGSDTVSGWTCRLLTCIHRTQEINSRLKCVESLEY